MHCAGVRFRDCSFSSSLLRLVAGLALILCCITGQLVSLCNLQGQAWAGACPQATAAARDWEKCPAIVEMDTPHAVYALGDVHGDYDRLVRLLVGGNHLTGAG
jgi:hypothetical protein